MAGSLGEKIGEGAFADVHAWAPGRVLKLARAGGSRRVMVHEARMTRAVFAAGGPAPEVLDEVTVDGRFGIVLPRFDGPTLKDLSFTGAMTSGEVGAVLAGLCLSVHRTPPPPEVLPLSAWMEGTMRVHEGRLPAHVGPGILALIERLAPGDGLCHCDLHPSNVIMTARGPRLIDWVGAVRAPAALDLACCHVLLTEIIATLVADPERPIAVNAALQVEYARLAGISPEALAADIEPYLPVVRVFVLLGGAASQLREQLIASVEASLRAHPGR